MTDYSVAESLKRVRLEHNFKQKDIADALGIDRTTYSYYESGRTKPSVKTLCILSKIYNVTIGYLIGKEANNPELRVRANYVSSEADPIALLKEKEQQLLMFYRILDEGSKEEILEEIIRKCRENEEKEIAELKNT